MYFLRSVPWLLGIATALIIGSGSATAQVGSASDARGLHASRAELEQMLSAYESGTNVGDAQIDSRAEARAIRHRLQEGDFQTGDQIVLVVETHPDLSGTYTVEPGREIILPGIGGVPLRGVLRSELDAHLASYLSQYVRNPRIRAQSTIRLMVLGGVSNPGFYSVPSHALVTDVIEAAGGTGRQSQLTRIRIEREGQQVIAGKALENAIIAGRTLDQLNVRAGDRIVIPERANNLAYTREILWFGSALVSAVLTLRYLF